MADIMDIAHNLAADLQGEIEKLRHDTTIDGMEVSDWVLQADSPSRIIRLAVCRAVHEMLWTSGNAGFGEEHQTASLMGHLSSNLAWYFRLAATAAAASKSSVTLPDIRWAHQEKDEEKTSGVDFGLLCNPSGESSPDTYVRVVLLQAKRALTGLKEEKFSIKQPTGLGGLKLADAKPYLNNATLRYCLHQALREHTKGDAEFLYDDVAAELSRHPAQTPRYQLESLLRTFFELSAAGLPSEPWCFYTVWRRPRSGQSPQLPATLTLGSVAAHLYSVARKDFETPVSAPVIAENRPNQDLIDVLGQALGYNPSSYGLNIRLDRLEQKMGEACRLLPGLLIVTSSSSSAGGHALSQTLKKCNFKVSPPLPPPDPLPSFTYDPTGPTSSLKGP